jgi:CubicO group peptidase (beta-lactamase class C family)
MKKFITIIFLTILYSGCMHNRHIKYKLDEYMNALTKQQKFSGAILVTKEGEILLSKGYSMANYELDVANTPSTKFRLASLTKQFTAMAIMLLQEQGLLSVHDNIQKYIADYPNGDKITIHHLLNHSSGMYDVGYLATYKEEILKPHTNEKVINLYKKLPLNLI